MQLRYKFRIYPDAEQVVALAKAFGCARTVFNDALQIRRECFEQGLPYVKDGDLSKLMTAGKATPERSYLNEVSSVVLQQALADLVGAYRSFFDSVTGRRKGEKVNPPGFRSRKGGQTIRFTRNAKFKILPNKRLRLAKVGDVRVVWTRPLPSDATSVTVKLDQSGRYFASFVVDVPDQPLPPVDRDVGIDLGLKHFAVFSDGSKVLNPRFLRRANRKIDRLQRGLSRKVQGSANWNKAAHSLSRAYAEVADTRRDWLHKLSTTVVRENQAVYVETLPVAKLARGFLRKSVGEAGWSAFVRMLEYKAARHHRIFGKVDRYFPSTRMCSDCGALGEKLHVGIRSWTCPCGAVHDRDVNAAINIRAAGRADLNDCGAQVSRGLVPAQRIEAVTHRMLPGVSRVVGRSPHIALADVKVGRESPRSSEYDDQLIPRSYSGRGGR